MIIAALSIAHTLHLRRYSVIEVAVRKGEAKSGGVHPQKIIWFPNTEVNH
jgi:hypothetical protein